MRWTDEAVRAVDSYLTGTCSVMIDDDGEIRDILDAAWAAQAKSDPWAKFLAGKWQDEPPQKAGRYLCQIARGGVVICNYRPGDGPWQDVGGGRLHEDYSGPWWSVALPEETPG